jgi:hypothetical protein
MRATGRATNRSATVGLLRRSYHSLAGRLRVFLLPVRGRVGFEHEPVGSSTGRERQRDGVSFARRR